MQNLSVQLPQDPSLQPAASWLLPEPASYYLWTTAFSIILVTSILGNSMLRSAVQCSAVQCSAVQAWCCGRC